MSIPAFSTTTRLWWAITAASWAVAGFDHNYNWYNPRGPNATCPDPSVPCDDDGHGFRTTGTMIGDDGGANQIGVAPGAEWIVADGSLPRQSGLARSAEMDGGADRIGGNKPYSAGRPDALKKNEVVGRARRQ